MTRLMRSPALSAALIHFNMQNFTDYLINQGMPPETMVLLFILPIVATIIAFSRQILGIKGFGIYTPLLITFAFLATGLRFGVAFFVIILLSATLVRRLIKKTRLMYLPRMAIIISAVAIFVSLIFAEGAYSNRIGLLNIPIIGLLILIVLAEKFINAQIERGAKEFVVLMSETLALSTICYLVFVWQPLRDIVLAYPIYVLAVVIAFNILLGKWTGLRLTEYFRFHSVIKNVDLPKKK